jgi:DNA-binding NarL/FixJ family response regulator
LERSTIRTLLVEDFRSFRAVVRSMLAENSLLRPICEASDGVEAIAKAIELRPDLILMDIGLPKLNGLEAARRIRELVPSAKIVFLTQENDPDVIQEAVGIGARGFIVKRQAGTELLAGLEFVLQGETFVSGGSASNLASEVSVSS